MLNSFILNLIPDRFKSTYDISVKSKGIVIAQLMMIVALTCIELYFGYFESNWHEIYLNLGVSIYIVGSIYLLRYFKSLESYVNYSLLGGYVVVFVFIILQGGIGSDAVFWLALLLSINISYTNKRHIIFWTIVIAAFICTLGYLQYNGFELPKFEYSITHRLINLLSFFMLMIATSYSFAKINVKCMDFQLDIITKHKWLNKEYDDLLSMVTHDLNSPSTRIEGLISIFDRENLTNKQKEILDLLNKTAGESKQLISGLSAATSFQSNLTLETIQLKEVLGHLKNGYLPLAKKKNIEIYVNVQKNTTVESSRSQLIRIFDNLISNAIKYSLYNKKVVIECSQDETHTSISVTDQGPGFTDEDQLKMFQKFQKLTARPTAGENSYGLGLSIIRRLSKELKGTINYTTALEKGSTFTLSIPNEFPEQFEI